VLDALARRRPSDAIAMLIEAVRREQELCARTFRLLYEQHIEIQGQRARITDLCQQLRRAHRRTTMRIPLRDANFDVDERAVRLVLALTDRGINVTVDGRGRFAVSGADRLTAATARRWPSTGTTCSRSPFICRTSTGWPHEPPTLAPRRERTRRRARHPPRHR
jgi:hypothetical protein